MAPSCRQRASGMDHFFIFWSIHFCYCYLLAQGGPTTTTHSSRKKVFKIFSWSVNEHLPYVLSLNNYNSLLKNHFFRTRLHFYNTTSQEGSFSINLNRNQIVFLFFHPHLDLSFEHVRKLLKSSLTVYNLALQLNTLELIYR